MTNIPKPVIDIVREGRAFLFLGAGASVGAISKNRNNPPIGKELGQLLVNKFLTPEYNNYTLPQIAELSISEYDISTVQEYIASIFEEFTPSEFHKLIPQFNWRGIATTNFDLIVERAFSEVKDRNQYLVVFKKDGEKVEEKLRMPNSVPYIKLHGCITDIYDQNVPLILTPDQYISHKKGRSRLFSKFLDFAYEYPLIFVGTSLSDIDLRAILIELDNYGQARPRSYIVTPEMSPAEVNFWALKKIDHIKMNFKDFLVELNSSFPKDRRILSTLIKKTDQPIFNKIHTDATTILSEELLTFLSRDVTYIHRDYKTAPPDPKSFYKGYFENWSPIASNLDVKRSFTDSVMVELFLANEEERSESCDFFVIKGHAGSGKSVILKRLAWDASIEYDKLCLFGNEVSFINFEPILELSKLYKERIFLFLDPITEFIDVINEIIPKARKAKIPLTIIGAERDNEWNTECVQLDIYLTRAYDVPYLSEKEIELLINLLSKYKSLGYLYGKSIIEQKEALGKHAGRQLLVALHEATSGKPFSDIVLDEYNSISSLRAKSLYLTVCIFHRLRVPVRAGLISRVHGIPFTEFENSLFKPLESIVFARHNEFIRDYEYRSRHSHIAGIVFERVLTDGQDRFDEYMRIINAIDIDYNPDRDALKGIINSKELLTLFRDPQMIRQLYKAAHARDDNNPMLYQQEALFEMHSSNGSLEKAASLLQKAYKLAPYSNSIAHSLSELAFIRAEKTPNQIERNKYLADSKKIVQGIISKGSSTAHPFHTKTKIELFELREIISSGDQASIERKIKDLEKSLSYAIQAYPDDSYIWDIEAQFNEIINKHSEALTALEKGFSINKRSGYIATRLAKYYEAIGEIEKSISVLKECLEENPSDKYVNYQLAMLLNKNPVTNLEEILFYLRRSFTTGDNNYMAQFWYARFKYLKGEINEAKEIFRKLHEVNIEMRIKQEPRGIVFENTAEKRFSGYVSKIEMYYGFIVRDNYQDEIYTNIRYNEEDTWSRLNYHKRITFTLAFNYYGPIAIKIQEE